tara:strand:+ start:214 stop:1344 length:1131 start_codon:yes stop_codon:yes gene_type:complete
MIPQEKKDKKNYSYIKEYLINDGKISNIKKNSINVISLFSGCGGFDIGAKLTGFNVAVSVDNDDQCVETLKKNRVFNNCKIIHKDINLLVPKDLKKFYKKKNNKLIIIAGPPCQPFSKAGYWITNKQRLIEKDPRNLFPSLFRFIKELKPDGFVIENVESLLHPSNIKIVEYIEKNILKLKYNFQRYKINSADFGVPQKRKRVFFIASKKKFKSILEKTHGSKNEIKYNKNLKLYEPVKNWIDQYENLKFSDNYDSTAGKYHEDLKKIPKGKNYIHLTKKSGYRNPKFVAGKRYWSFLLKLDPNQPSPTIISSPGHWEGPFHWSNRRLRIKELAAIQTFPSDYIFYGSRRSVQKQIGNAVPPILAKEILKHLKNNI